jgi:hypothetical protein
MDTWNGFLFEEARQPRATEPVRVASSPPESEGLKKPHTTLEIDSFVMDTS